MLPPLLLTLASVTLLLVACGGDDDNSSGSDSGAGPTSGSSTTTSAKATTKPGATKNEKWVQGLCVAVTGYEADLEKLSGTVSVSQADSSQKVKDTIVTFLQDAQKRTVKLQSDIKGLGDPDGKDGKKIEAAMVDAAGTAVRVFDKSVKDAQALKTSDAAQLQADVIAIGSDLESASSDISDAFSRIDQDYDTTEITKIAATVPECSGLF
jgi:hypothetical protein